MSEDEKQLYNTYSFEQHASRPKNALALIYDLEGFSQFFNQPDVQDYVPQFINYVGAAIASLVNGGESFWCPPDAHKGSLLAPIHEKYLGDGALYLFSPPDGEAFDPKFLIELTNRLWNLKNNFDVVLTSCAEEVPVFELPRRIRFGVARGTVYELTNAATGENEYIGFCINLASRLQKYCPALGFIASARINLPEEALRRNDYIKVVAKRIHGFSKEIVIVDRDEFMSMDPDEREYLFETLPNYEV